MAKKDTHTVKVRTYRLSKDLDDRWQAYLDAQGETHNQAIKAAIEAYLYNYYPQDTQNE